MQRWEYRTYEEKEHAADLVTSLNALGADGWELIHLEVRYGQFCLILKRPIVDRGEYVSEGSQ